MIQKTANTFSTESNLLNQEKFTVYIKDLNEYVGVKDVNAALDFIDDFVIACNDPITDGSGITIEPGKLTIHRGNPAEVKSRLISNKHKAMRKVATV